MTDAAFVAEVIGELDQGYFYWIVEYRFNHEVYVFYISGLQDALAECGYALGAEIVTPATAGGVGRVALTIVDSEGIKLGTVYELDYRYAA